MVRILLVEDDYHLSCMVRDWLAELGYEPVGPVPSVKSALELIANEPLDGAILDVSLRNEDSYPVADALGERGVPFVFATGYGASGLAPRFRDTPVLSKPFLFADVRRAVARMHA